MPEASFGVSGSDLTPVSFYSNRSHLNPRKDCADTVVVVRVTIDHNIEVRVSRPVQYVHSWAQLTNNVAYANR